LEHLLCLFSVKIKVWNHVLGWRWKIYKDIPATKEIIRLITGVHKRESCRPIFRKYQILTLTSLYIFEMLCFLKKHQGNVKQNLEINGHNTRKKHDLHTRHCSTILYQTSVTNMSIKLFNNLPIQIKQLDDYKSFKRELKTFLVCNSFYTIEEFLHYEGF